MALIRNIEPDLRELIAYVIAGARERRATLNRMRVVKLLYLVDVESIRTRREPVTGVRWLFVDNGPHAQSLVELLQDMERHSALYRAASDDAPDADNWTSGTRRTVDSVVERFAALPANELLDHVYFHTGPMSGAERGRPLDMLRARDDGSPRRPSALRPPPRSDDVQQRLAARRKRTVARARAPHDNAPGLPAAFLDDRVDELSDARIKGRIAVPADCEP